MQITKAKIENFLTIGEAEIKLSEKGLVLIQGENQEDPSANSNGAGKSSVPDALCWSLYGETARGVKGDAVINRTAKKGTDVSVTIDDEGDEIVVSRYRKHKTHKNRLVVSVNGTDMTKGTDKLTQEYIEKLMGCSLDVFRAAVYSGQEAMPDLPGMTDKHLKVLVEEAAGIDRLQAAYEVARAEARAVLAELGKEETTLEEAEKRVVYADEDLVESKRRQADWSKERTEEMVKAKVRLKGDLAMIHTMEADYDADELDNLNDEIDGVRAEIDGVDSEKDREKELKDAEGKAIFEQMKAQDALELKEKGLETAKAAVARVDHKVGKSCSECGKPHTVEDLAGLRVRAIDKVKTLEEEVTLQTVALVNAESGLLSRSNALKEHQDTMTDISASITLERELLAGIKKLTDTRHDIDSRKDKFKAELERVKEFGEKENPHDEAVTKDMNKIERAKKEVKEAEVRVKELSAKANLHNEAVEVFGQKGVRAHILDSVTPYLNDRTAHYLGTLSDGNISAVWSTLTTTTKGEVREKFNIEVTNDTGSAGFMGLSGGEKRKVRLAAAMALQDMVASRASKPINLFIADEVDHALDAAGLERLMSLLDEKARERGTVLVISHNELGDWIRNQATVTKKGGYASISGALS